jgi:hypothetical protein
MGWAGVAFWYFGRLQWFDPAALAGDFASGVAVVLSLAGLCAWSRRSARPQETVPNTVDMADRGPLVTPMARVPYFFASENPLTVLGGKPVSGLSGK